MHSQVFCHLAGSSSVRIIIIIIIIIVIIIIIIVTVTTTKYTTYKVKAFRRKPKKLRLFSHNKELKGLTEVKESFNSKLPL